MPLERRLSMIRNLARRLRGPMLSAPGVLLPGRRLPGRLARKGEALSPLGVGLSVAAASEHVGMDPILSGSAGRRNYVQGAGVRMAFVPTAAAHPR